MVIKWIIYLKMIQAIMCLRSALVYPLSVKKGSYLGHPNKRAYGEELDNKNNK
jgi:hypothetical protein